MNVLKRKALNFNPAILPHRSTALVVATLLAVYVTITSPASRADDPTQAPGPAARAVRLSSVDGQVQLAQANQVLAASAVANTPLFEGTRITTGDDGRAEIQFEDGSIARLSPNSVLTLNVLRGAGPNGTAEIALEGGLGYFELQQTGQSGAMIVKFGDSQVTASGFTVMRINLDTPPGALAVFSGNAHVERGSALSVDLHGGESVSLSADDISRYTLNEIIEPDSWDAWNADRDQALSAEAAATTSAGKQGGQAGNPAWSDLDANGSWYNVPGQGNVWSPYDASSPGFDPYGNGSWAYTPAYGYSFVSGYSWGYLPYQCGLWNWYGGFGWGWAPGMGGCNPWWGNGGYGYFGTNLGTGFNGYRPPIRPRPPRRPLGTLIAINHRQMAPVSSLPLRDRTSVVTIAGNTVSPLRSVSPRLQYDRTTVGAGNRTSAPGGVGASQVRSASGVATPAHPGPAPSKPASPSHSASFNSGAGASRAASAPASHASSGGSGGGGGGAHAGSGGGGGHH